MEETIQCVREPLTKVSKTFHISGFPGMGCLVGKTTEKGAFGYLIPQSSFLIAAILNLIAEILLK